MKTKFKEYIDELKKLFLGESVPNDGGPSSKEEPEETDILTPYIVREDEAGLFVQTYIEGMGQIYLRKNSSDTDVFKQIFVYREYAPLIQAAQQVFADEEEIAIVDCGANIGLSALYLLHYFPMGETICLEPFEENTLLMEKNIFELNRPRKEVKVIRGALWSSNTDLGISRDFRDGKEWSVQTVADAPSRSIKGYTVADLREIAGGKIDILKIDIEGAEFEVFSNATTFKIIRDIGVLAIEFHDEVGDASAMKRKLMSSGFFLFDTADMTIAVNKNRL